MPSLDTDVWPAFIRGGRQDLRTIKRHYAEYLRLKKGQYVKRYRALHADDVRNEVELGFYQAAAKYDTAFGVKFETFAELRIRGAVQDFTRQLDSLTRSDRANGFEINVGSIDDAPEDGTSLAAILPAAHEDMLYHVEDVELWHVILGALRSRYEYRVVAITIFRMGWLHSETAKFLGYTASNISVLLGKIREILQRSVSLKMYLEGRTRRHKNKTKNKSNVRYSIHGNFNIAQRGGCGTHPCCRLDCPNKAKCRGMCVKHYKEHVNRDRLCTVEGCDRNQWCRNYCSRHYDLYRTYGTPTPILKIAKPGTWTGKTCEHCKKRPVKFKGVCGPCYNRDQYYAKQGKPTPDYIDPSRLCACGAKAGRSGKCFPCYRKAYRTTWLKSEAGKAYKTNRANTDAKYRSKKLALKNLAAEEGATTPADNLGTMSPVPFPADADGLRAVVADVAEGELVRPVESPTVGHGSVGQDDVLPVALRCTRKLIDNTAAVCESQAALKTADN